MIFTKEQWERVYFQYRADRSYSDVTRPADLILDILEKDAVEHGIHPTWVQFWVDREDRARWANAVYVMLHYQPGKYGERSWDKPR